MTKEQAWAVIILMIIQAVGIWERVVFAMRQYKLEQEKFDYVKNKKL